MLDHSFIQSLMAEKTIFLPGLKGLYSDITSLESRNGVIYKSKSVCKNGLTLAAAWPVNSATMALVTTFDDTSKT